MDFVVWTTELLFKLLMKLGLVVYTDGLSKDTARPMLTLVCPQFSQLHYWMWPPPRLNRRQYLETYLYIYE